MGQSQRSSFVVLKFGGTSVSSAENWRVIADVVRKRRREGSRPVVVCSALSGVSDLLEQLIDTACAGHGHEAVLEEIKTLHEQLAVALGLSAAGDGKRKGGGEALLATELSALSRLALGVSLTGDAGPKLRARMMAFGELMATRLGAAYLEQEGLSPVWMDARELLVARKDVRVGELQQYTHATCCHERDEKLIALLDELVGPVGGDGRKAGINNDKGELVLTQGFIAANAEGETVLLGRGGSDTSAAYLAAALGAQRCEIWTDVPGIFTANPYAVVSARLIRSLDYAEAQEITTSGAGVLHPRCIAPLRDADIPLEVRCTHAPDIAGTVISREGGEGAPHVKCISSKSGVLLVSMDAIDMWQQVGFLVEAFSVFKRAGLSIDMVSTSETNVTVSLDTNVQALEARVIEAVTTQLGEFCTVRTIGPCAIVNLVGRHIRTIMHELGPTMKVFEEKRIHLVSQASNDLNFSFVVDEEEAPRLVKRLHALLLEEGVGGASFGPCWRELFDAHKTVRESAVWAWWRERREPLLAQAHEQTPVFVYDEATLQARIRDLQSFGAVDRVLYAVKANWHPEILRAIAAAGFGFECVSLGEIRHLQKVFSSEAGDMGEAGVAGKPGDADANRTEFDPTRVLFTPNFAPRQEYEAAFELGVYVTLDNLYPLVAWPEVFAGRKILVRLDPGKGRGHHKHVHTAGAHAKFGIPPADLEAVAARAKENGTRIIGLHAHSGSGIRKPGNWRETAVFLARWQTLFPEARIFDLGGGLGVVEKPGQTPLSLQAVRENLAAIKEAYPDRELWLEPGRFLVAEQGVLLARVTQVKGKGDTRYVGLDVGMNTLIRPALYGAYHEIVNLTKLESVGIRPKRAKSVQANVVGFICESGDTFGRGRRLAEPEEGDILLIATAGAYGRTMSSHYNLRPPAREVFLPKQ
jgi:diaminopimelate decarboxylase/aspartate kinase